MVVRHKPPPKVVKKSAKELPSVGVRKVQRSEDAVILDVQKNAPLKSKAEKRYGKKR
jgi:hypothetical protein